MADGESQPSAAILARDGDVGLSKFLEQILALFRADPDPAVGHLKTDPRTALGFGLIDAHCNLPVVCELAGIAKKVEQDLPHLGHISPHQPETFGEIKLEGIGILRNCRLEGRDHF